MNGRLPKIVSQDLQPEGPTQAIISWQPLFEESSAQIGKDPTR